MPENDNVMTFADYLNSVSSQCARGKSTIARKPEVNGKNLLQNVTLQILNFIPVS